MEKKYTSTITMLIFLIMTRKMRQRPWKEIEIIELYAGADYSAPLELNLFSIKWRPWDRKVKNKVGNQPLLGDRVIHKSVDAEAGY